MEMVVAQMHLVLVSEMLVAGLMQQQEGQATSGNDLDLIPPRGCTRDVAICRPIVHAKFRLKDTSCNMSIFQPRRKNYICL